MNKKGFTLIELIFALAVSTIILQAIISFYLISFRSWNDTIHKNRITNQFIDISQRTFQQINTTGTIDKESLPLKEETHINYALPNNIIKISTQKKEDKIPTFSHTILIRKEF